MTKKKFHYDWTVVTRAFLTPKFEKIPILSVFFSLGYPWRKLTKKKYQNEFCLNRGDEYNSKMHSFIKIG